MAPRDQSAAPWALTATAPVFDVQVRRHREQYRNRQYLTGARAETSEQVEEFVGDGTRRTFTVGFPISREPTVYRNGVAQTVGVKADSAANTAQWFWTNADPVLTQGNEEGITTWPVSSAGDSDYDGSYTQDGFFGDKPAYTNANDLWLFWAPAAGAWLLNDTKSNYIDPADAAYYGDVGTAELPALTWTAGTAAGPAPDVGQTNEIWRFASAGSDGFNGDYTYEGAFGGKNYYTNPVGNYLFWGTTAAKWMLDTALTNHAAASSAAYYGTGADLGANPWSGGTGANPAPSATEESEIGPSVTTNLTLTAADILRVEYIGAFNLVLRMDSDEEVAARGVAEGGTGLYSTVRQESGLWELGTLVQFIEADLRRYGSMGTEITFDTFTAGLAAGQLLTVDLPEHSISGEWLIAEVDLQEVFPAYGATAALYSYRVTALSGEAVGGWVDFFRAWELNDNIGSLIDGQPETIIIAADPFSKFWPEDEHPNIFYRITPATDLYPSDTSDGWTISGATNPLTANGLYSETTPGVYVNPDGFTLSWGNYAGPNWAWLITKEATTYFRGATAEEVLPANPWVNIWGAGTVVCTAYDAADDPYPQFEPYYEVRFLSVYNGAGNEVARKQITTLFEYTDTLIGTMTVLAPADYAGDITHVGWWGGDAATSTLGTGVLLDQQAYVYTKTALEGILFTKRDYKGWGTSRLDVRAEVSSGFWRDEDGIWGVYQKAITSGGGLWPREAV